MSDLIDRKNTIDVLQILADKMTDEGKTVMAQAISVLRDLSAEQETAKVEKKEKVYEGIDHMFAYETWGECGNCGEPVKQGANYCSWCGMKLDWSNDE